MQARSFRDSQHILALDGLRGLAALLVVVAHAHPASWLSPGLGQQAVTLFFVLSGFLMAHLYSSRASSGTAVRQYLRHRAARVVPLYLLVVILSWALRSSVTALQVRTSDLWQHLLFLRGDGILWTVPAEVQFYFAFLLLWAAFTRYRARGLLAATVVLECSAAGSVWLAHARGVDLTWLALAKCMHFFLAGVLLATIRARFGGFLSRLQGRAWCYVASCACLTAVCLVATSLRFALGWPSIPTWIDPAVILTTLAFFCGGVLRCPGFGFLSWSSFRWLGRISYSLYLLHPCVISLVDRAITIFRLERSIALPVTLVVSLVFATASFQFVERPLQNFINGKRRIQQGTSRAGTTNSTPVQDEAAAFVGRYVDSFRQ